MGPNNAIYVKILPPFCHLYICKLRNERKKLHHHMEYPLYMINISKGSLSLPKRMSFRQKNRNIFPEKGAGGGQRLFGTFPKIHRFW